MQYHLFVYLGMKLCENVAVLFVYVCVRNEE
jgi:hypothetical protein